MVALFCAFLFVVVSLLVSSWSAENPIVVDDEIGIVKFFEGLASGGEDTSSSAW